MCSSRWLQLFVCCRHSALLPSAESPPTFVLVGFPLKIIQWRSLCCDGRSAAELPCCSQPPSSGHHSLCSGTSCSICCTAPVDFRPHSAKWNTLLVEWYFGGESRGTRERSQQRDRGADVEGFTVLSSPTGFCPVEIICLRDGFSIRDPSLDLRSPYRHWIWLRFVLLFGCFTMVWS